MEQSSIGPKPDFIDDGGLKVDKDGPGNVLARPGLGEEGGEAVVPECLVAGHVAVWLDAVLEAVELPARVADLNPGLADVDGDTLTLKTQQSSLTSKCLPSNQSQY